MRYFLAIIVVLCLLLALQTKSSINSGNYRMLVLTNTIESSASANGPWIVEKEYWFVVIQNDTNRYFRSVLKSGNVQINP